MDNKLINSSLILYETPSQFQCAIAEYYDQLVNCLDLLYETIKCNYLELISEGIGEENVLDLQNVKWTTQIKKIETAKERCLLRCKNEGGQLIHSILEDFIILLVAPDGKMDDASEIIKVVLIEVSSAHRDGPPAEIYQNSSCLVDYSIIVPITFSMVEKMGLQTIWSNLTVPIYVGGLMNDIYNKTGSVIKNYLDGPKNDDHGNQTANIFKFDDFNCCKWIPYKLRLSRFQEGFAKRNFTGNLTRPIACNFFNTLSSLKELQIFEKLCNNIKCGLFTSLVNLVHLELYWSILSIEKGALALPQLKYLKLGKLYELTKDVFFGTNLEILHLTVSTSSKIDPDCLINVTADSLSVHSQHKRIMCHDNNSIFCSMTKNRDHYGTNPTCPYYDYSFLQSFNGKKER